MAVTLPHCKHPLTTYERFVLTITMQQCRQQPALQLPHGKLMHSSGGTAHTSQTMLSISTDAYLLFMGLPGEGGTRREAESAAACCHRCCCCSGSNGFTSSECTLLPPPTAAAARSNPDVSHGCCWLYVLGGAVCWTSCRDNNWCRRCLHCCAGTKLAVWLTDSSSQPAGAGANASRHTTQWYKRQM